MRLILVDYNIGKRKSEIPKGGSKKIIPDESILLTIKTSKEEILDLRIGFIRYFFF